MALDEQIMLITTNSADRTDYVEPRRDRGLSFDDNEPHELQSHQSIFASIAEGVSIWETGTPAQR